MGAILIISLGMIGYFIVDRICSSIEHIAELRSKDDAIESERNFDYEYTERPVDQRIEHGEAAK